MANKKHRLVKVAKTLNVSPKTLLNFFEKKKITGLLPNSKLTDEQYKLVIEEFVKDKYKKIQLLEDLEKKTKVDAKKTDTTEQKTHEKETTKQQKEDTDIEKEQIISAKEEAAKRVKQPKTYDKIDLSDKKKKQQKIIKEEQKPITKPTEEQKTIIKTDQKKEQETKQTTTIPDEKIKQQTTNKNIKPLQKENIKDEKITSEQKTTIQTTKSDNKQQPVQNTQIQKDKKIIPEPKTELKEQKTTIQATKSDNKQQPVQNTEQLKDKKLKETDQTIEKIKEEKQEYEKIITSGDAEIKVFGKIDLQAQKNKDPKTRKKDKKKDKKFNIKKKKDFKDKKKKETRRVEKVDIEKEKSKKRFDKDKKRTKRKQQYKDDQKKGKKEINFIKEKDVNKAIKEVSKQMQKTSSRKTKQKQRKIQQEFKQKIKVPQYIRINELAKLLDIEPEEIIEILMDIGHPATLNYLLDTELTELVLNELSIPFEIDTESFEEKIEKLIDQDTESEQSVPRPPIVTVMGHVDHGKTTLLDYIRNTKVAEKEKGGITQHIGAYHVLLEEYKDLLDSKIHSITFIDTPGHEAFTSMRAKGTKVTDIAIIVVAADDSVMPTTIEAINHAKAANIPMIFAINKIDKPNADPQKIKQDLLNHNIVLEDFGGPHPSVEISAKTGQNVDKLLELILLQAELLELKANPKRNAIATVIESRVEKGRGPLATVIVRTGTLKKGDPIWSGPYHGRVKAMFNELQKKIKEAGPSIPVQIMGLNGTPTPGEPLIVEESENEAKKKALQRDREYREISRKRIISLEKIAQQLADTSEKVKLPLIIKADVLGSAEAINDTLYELSNDKVEIQVIHRAAGQITENDVTLASASDAIILGFNVRPSNEARKKAEELKVEIRLYSLIYKLIEDIEAAIKGMIKKEKKEIILGSAEVLKTFKISKIGTIAGCIVRDGKITRNSSVRIIRDGITVYTGQIASLRRFDKDVNEVLKDYECGIRIENFNDIKRGDFIEAFQLQEEEENE